MIDYIYKAKMLRVVDGDTAWVDIDLGFRMTKKERVRLAGINAPEMRGADREAGLASKNYLNMLIADAGDKLTLQTSKEGKYGRWLAVLFDGEGNNINQAMITAGFAVEYKK